ncbi:MAG: glutamate synthase subunit beta [Acidobacteria bacterium]|nr:glutamate synthase subunit beta [Acidobacteriota bacterium]
MGKSTGFIEYARQLPEDRDPRDRVKDWNEFHPRVPAEALKRQGARCMDCGTPYCHTGKLMAGMASGCPLNNLIPDFNDLVYHGQWQRALRRLLKTNNFPEFTGRVCPAPCEGSCTVGLDGDPVTIKAIECSIIDTAFEEGWVGPELPALRTGKKVAIVGSGPAGLACAAQLNLAGHTVTVFERADRIGGLLMYGIPNMKLDKALVERRVGLMARNGIRFVTGVEIGRDIPSEKLLEEYHATVFCCGATQARELEVEGRRLAGVHLAMDYLTANTKSLLDSRLEDGAYISGKDKDVVVIGGGDTGTDCVGTALRHGARSVTQFEILPRPPALRGRDNPWPQWPKVAGMDYGQEEAAALQGADPRHYGILTKRFAGDGAVAEVHTVDLRWTRSGERMQSEEVPGSGRVFPAQLVLLALGFTGPERKGPITELGLKLDGRGNVVCDGQRMTSVPGVFAAGDMVRGQSLVVWAIHEGRNTARSVDRYLMYGETYLP